MKRERGRAGRTAASDRGRAAGAAARARTASTVDTAPTAGRGRPVEPRGPPTADRTTERGLWKPADAAEEVADGSFEQGPTALPLDLAVADRCPQLVASRRVVTGRLHRGGRCRSERRSAWTSSASISTTRPATTSATRPSSSCDQAWPHPGSREPSSRLSYSSSASSSRSSADSVRSSCRSSGRIAIVGELYTTALTALLVSVRQRESVPARSRRRPGVTSLATRW